MAVPIVTNLKPCSQYDSRTMLRSIAVLHHFLNWLHLRNVITMKIGLKSNFTFFSSVQPMKLNQSHVAAKWRKV